MPKFVDITTVGSRVLYRPSFGMDEPVTVTVTNVEADIKNGLPGFDTDAGTWAYASQVLRVETNGARYVRLPGTDLFISN